MPIKPFQSPVTEDRSYTGEDAVQAGVGTLGAGAAAWGAKGLQDAKKLPNAVDPKRMVISYGEWDGSGAGHKAMAHRYAKNLNERGFQVDTVKTDGNVHRSGSGDSAVVDNQYQYAARAHTGLADALHKRLDSAPEVQTPGRFKHDFAPNATPEDLMPFSPEKAHDYDPDSLRSYLKDSHGVDTQGRKIVTIAAGGQGTGVDWRTRRVLESLADRDDVHVVVAPGAAGKKPEFQARMKEILGDRTNASILGDLDNDSFHRVLSSSHVNVGYTGANAVADQLAYQNHQVNLHLGQNPQAVHNANFARHYGVNHHAHKDGIEGFRTELHGALDRTDHAPRAADAARYTEAARTNNQRVVQSFEDAAGRHSTVPLAARKRLLTRRGQMGLAAGVGLTGAAMLGDNAYRRYRAYRQRRQMQHGRTLQKTAGGPGSGVAHDNTEKIDLDRYGLKMSTVISIGKRRSVMDACDPTSTKVSVPLDKIKFIGQRNYVVGKLASIMSKKDGDWRKSPVQLYFDGQAYHVMDGHHRFLAALRLPGKTIRANVWTTLPSNMSKEADFDELFKAALNVPMRALRRMPAQMQAALAPAKASQMASGRMLARQGKATNQLAMGYSDDASATALSAAHKYVGQGAGQYVAPKAQTRLQALGNMRAERVQKMNHPVAAQRKSPLAPGTDMERQVVDQMSSRLHARGARTTNGTPALPGPKGTYPAVKQAPVANTGAPAPAYQPMSGQQLAAQGGPKPGQAQAASMARVQSGIPHPAPINPKTLSANSTATFAASPDGQAMAPALGSGVLSGLIRKTATEQLTERLRAKATGVSAETREKLAAATSYTQDFTSGIDPFSTMTAEYGRRNQEAGLGEGHHRAKQMLGVAGGVVGGAALIPGLTNAVMDSSKIWATTKGNRRQRAGQMVAGLGKAILEPTAGLLRGRRAVKALNRASVGPAGHLHQLDGKDSKALDYVLRKVPAGDIADQMAAKTTGGDALDKYRAYQKAQATRNNIDKGLISSEDAKELLPSAKDGYSGYRNGLLVGGAFGAGGAYINYGVGRGMEQGFQDRQKTAARRYDSFLDDLSPEARAQIAGLEIGEGPRPTRLMERSRQLAEMKAKGGPIHKGDYYEAQTLLNQSRNRAHKHHYPPSRNAHPSTEYGSSKGGFGSGGRVGDFLRADLEDSLGSGVLKSSRPLSIMDTLLERPFPSRAPSPEVIDQIVDAAPAHVDDINWRLAAGLAGGAALGVGGYYGYKHLTRDREKTAGLIQDVMRRMPMPGFVRDAPKYTGEYVGKTRGALGAPVSTPAEEAMLGRAAMAGAVGGMLVGNSLSVPVGEAIERMMPIRRTGVQHLVGPMMGPGAAVASAVILTSLVAALMAANEKLKDKKEKGRPTEKTAFLGFKNDDELSSPEAGVAGLGSAVAGTGLLAGRKAIEGGPDTSSTGLAKLKAFSQMPENVAKTIDPAHQSTAFAREYVRQGSDLMNAEVGTLASGKKMTGRDAALMFWRKGHEHVGAPSKNLLKRLDQGALPMTRMAGGGAAIGAVIGGATAGEGERVEGAATGGAIGGALGGATRMAIPRAARVAGGFFPEVPTIGHSQNHYDSYARGADEGYKLQGREKYSNPGVYEPNPRLPHPHRPDMEHAFRTNALNTYHRAMEHATIKTTDGKSVVNSTMFRRKFHELLKEDWALGGGNPNEPGMGKDHFSASTDAEIKRFAGNFDETMRTADPVAHAELYKLGPNDGRAHALYNKAFGTQLGGKVTRTRNEDVIDDVGVRRPVPDSVSVDYQGTKVDPARVIERGLQRKRKRLRLADDVSDTEVLTKERSSMRADRPLAPVSESNPLRRVVHYGEGGAADDVLRNFHDMELHSHRQKAPNLYPHLGTTFRGFEMARKGSKILGRGLKWGGGAVALGATGRAAYNAYEDKTASVSRDYESLEFQIKQDPEYRRAVDSGNYAVAQQLVRKHVDQEMKVKTLEHARRQRQFESGELESPEYRSSRIKGSTLLGGVAGGLAGGAAGYALGASADVGRHVFSSKRYTRPIRRGSFIGGAALGALGLGMYSHGAASAGGLRPLQADAPDPLEDELANYRQIQDNLPNQNSYDHRYFVRGMDQFEANEPKPVEKRAGMPSWILGGAAAGGIAGGALNYHNAPDPDEQLRHTLAGGIAGATLGAGVGMVGGGISGAVKSRQARHALKDEIERAQVGTVYEQPHPTVPYYPERVHSAIQPEPLDARLLAAPLKQNRREALLRDQPRRNRLQAALSNSFFRRAPKTVAPVQRESVSNGALALSSYAPDAQLV